MESHILWIFSNTGRVVTGHAQRPQNLTMDVSFVWSNKAVLIKIACWKYKGIRSKRTQRKNRKRKRLVRRKGKSTGPKRINTSNKPTRETWCPWTSQRNHCIIFTLKTNPEHPWLPPPQGQPMHRLAGKGAEEQVFGVHPTWSSKLLLLLWNHSRFIKKILHSSVVQDYKPLVCRCQIMQVWRKKYPLKKKNHSKQKQTHHGQRYFKTEHTWWPHWARRTSRCSVTRNIEVQIKIIQSVQFCVLQTTKQKTWGLYCKYLHILSAFFYMRYCYVYNWFHPYGLGGFSSGYFCQKMPVIF